MISSSVKNDEKKALIEFICWKYSKFNLVALLKYLKYDGFLEFLDVFSGSYIKVPAASRIVGLLDKYRLLKLHQLGRELYREKKLLEYHANEVQFEILCNKIGIKKEVGHKLAIKFEKELKEATDWYSRLESLEHRQC